MTERTDLVWSFAFVGVTGLVCGWINTFEMTVAARWGDEAWDPILDLDAYPLRVEGGIICRICRPSALFESRTALWADHLFEPFLAWVNDTLAPSPWLELTGTADNGATSARLCRDLPEEEAARGRLPVLLVPVRCGPAEKSEVR